MSTWRYLKITVYISLLMFVLSSCKTEVKESVQSASDEAQIETEFSAIFDVVADYTSGDVRTNKTDNNYILPSGATVTFIDSLYNDGDGIDFIIDYGPLNHDSTYQGIMCRDGRYRAGKIHVGMDKRWSDLPVAITIASSSADNYYAGPLNKMHQATINASVTRLSNTNYTLTVSNATLQRDNGTVSWNAQLTALITVTSPSGWWNNEYQLTGTAGGTNANGESFTVETVAPLQKRISSDCASSFFEGQLKVTDADHVLNVNFDAYGNQACDKVAQVTFNGHSEEIILW